MAQVNLKVRGMSCTNCALTIDKYLKQQGMQQVKVNFIGGDVSFNDEEMVGSEKLIKGIESLGYQVDNGNGFISNKPGGFLHTHMQRFLFCLVFTAPMLIGMIPGIHIPILMNPYVQLTLTIPVYIVGMGFFGKSGLRSLKKGVPNMNVLIALGATAAFVYSLYGTLTFQDEQYMFYETAAAIITLVFLGNWMEDKSVETTQRSIKALTRDQKVMANMIAYDEHHEEHVFPVESNSLKVGDLILIKDGEIVPMDSKILWGEASVNEAIITGESLPVEKTINDIVIGGSILQSGTVKAYVTQVGELSVMGNILKMVKDAQSEKPPIQQLADKISAVFVPVVIGISLVTFGANYFFTEVGFGDSLLRSIAVLVIACPCAMGLATPAAIAVGLGRAARNGVLFKNAKSLEIFKDIKQVVFDKTGTLTTGNFTVSNYHIVLADKWNNDDFKRLVYSLEKFSGHPLAKSIVKEWKVNDAKRWARIKEVKGLGIHATDKAGNIFMAGSFKMVKDKFPDLSHDIYITHNEEVIGWIDVTDEIRVEAKTVVSALRAKGLRTILLSGDKKEKCERIARELHLDEVYAEQTPDQKLETIALLNNTAPTAMVGDGINDAPALAKATVGISLSEASQIAMQSAQVVLMHHGLQKLPLSLGLGKHTYLTIKQNLFWAFFYNIIAIPVAAFGFLSPAIGAFVMGLSDVVLAINSVRLNYKRVQ